MFRCGDQVVYGVHGVCTIVGIEKHTVDRKKLEYYVLCPADRSDARYFVPTQNPAAVSKMRKVLTASELNQLLASEEVRESAWIADENLRKQRYRELISSGDRKELLRMVHTLHNHKKSLLVDGKKFHLCDENFLRDAEKLLSGEFSLVLNMDPLEISSYLAETMLNS